MELSLILGKGTAITVEDGIIPEVEGKMRTENRVREVREKEGVSRAELSRLAGLSDKTIRKVEEGRGGSPVTKNRVAKGINRIPDKEQEYSVEDLFPNDDLSR